MKIMKNDIVALLVTSVQISKNGLKFGNIHKIHLIACSGNR